MAQNIYVILDITRKHSRWVSVGQFVSTVMKRKKLRRKQVIWDIEALSGASAGEAFLSHIRMDREKIPLHLI